MDAIKSVLFARLPLPGRCGPGTIEVLLMCLIAASSANAAPVRNDTFG